MPDPSRPDTRPDTRSGTRPDPDGAPRADAPGDPPYELRVSARARRVTLRVVPGRGLVVTVPKRSGRRAAAAAVAEHRTWALAELARLEACVPEAFRHWPPRVLELPGIGRRLVLGFDPAAARTASVRSSVPSETVLTLGCAPADRDAAAAALGRWLAAEARAHLGPRLSRLAARHGLAYARLSIRGQRTLWGSCSQAGRISLNWKLLFLRPALVDYVLLHELAHTRHLDHSPAFWALLEDLLPGAAALDAELRDAGPKVPPWFERRGVAAR